MSSSRTEPRRNHTMPLSHERSELDRVRRPFVLPPRKANAVKSGGDTSVNEGSQSKHRDNHPSMLLASDSFRLYGAHKKPALGASNGGNEIVMIPTRSQSIPWTTTTPTHSSIHKSLLGSFTFLPTPPPTTHRPLALPRAPTERLVFSPLVRKQKPASATSTPGPTSHRVSKPKLKYIRNVLPYHRTPRATNVSAAFSNARSALSLSVILPLLLSYSDMITRIQFRSTCQLYRLAFHTYMRSRMGLEDIRFDPLAGDPSKAVYIRDWHAKFRNGTPRVWMNLHLAEVWRDVETAELRVPLIRGVQASFFFFARLPCVPEDEWTVEKYLAGFEHREKVRTPRHERRTRIGIDHEVFGRIEKETWHHVKGPVWYTVEDLARMLTQRYKVWNQEAGDCAEEGWKRAVVLRWDKGLEGYVFDASMMVEWKYP